MLELLPRNNLESESDTSEWQLRARLQEAETRLFDVCQFALEAANRVLAFNPEFKMDGLPEVFSEGPRIGGSYLDVTSTPPRDLDLDKMANAALRDNTLLLLTITAVALEIAQGLSTCL